MFKISHNIKYIYTSGPATTRGNQLGLVEMGALQPSTFATRANTAVVAVVGTRAADAPPSPRGVAIEEATTCNICYELFTDVGGERVPLQLPCGHCNCSSCVSHLDWVGKRCPLCKTQYAGSAATLPKNYTALHILGFGPRQDGVRPAGVRPLRSEGNHKNPGGGFPFGNFFIANVLGCYGYGIIRNCFRSNKVAADTVYFSLGALNILGPFLFLGSDIPSYEEGAWGALSCICGFLQSFLQSGDSSKRASTVLTLLLLKIWYKRAELWAPRTEHKCTWKQWLRGVFNPVSGMAFYLGSYSGSFVREFAAAVAVASAEGFCDGFWSRISRTRRPPTSRRPTLRSIRN